MRLASSRSSSTLAPLQERCSASIELACAARTAASAAGEAPSSISRRED